MEKMENITSTYNYGGVEWLCEPWLGAGSTGIGRGENPLKFALPLLLLQISVVSLFSAFFQFLLRPFGKFQFLTQILAGISLGPSVIGRNKQYMSTFFYTRSLYIIESYEAMCFLFICYITTCQVDTRMIKRVGKLAFINGILLFLIPFVWGQFTAILISKRLGGGPAGIPPVEFHHIGIVQSTMWFQVVYGVLSSLKMLNTEPGRLALASMMVHDCLSWCFFMVNIAVKLNVDLGDKSLALFMAIAQMLMIGVIVYVFRPIMKWMMKRTPEGHSLKASYLSVICVLLFLSSLWAEFVRLPYFFGAVVLGLATPKRQPLGTGLSDKMGCFVWSVLMPCYIIGIGYNLDLSLFSFRDVIRYELLFGVVRFAKMVAIALPSLYFNVPLWQAILVGFIVNIQGIYDVQIYKQNLNYTKISTKSFGAMVMSATVNSTVIIVIVKKLYHTMSKRNPYKRRTVQHCRAEAPLRILTCFRQREAVRPVLDLLELSRPVIGSPLSVFAVNLEELNNHSLPLLIHHTQEISPFIVPSRREQIVKAFHNYEKTNPETVLIECFTAVAPRKTMHEDVCAISFDQETDLVVLTLDAGIESWERQLCRNLLQTCPCSVALFIDRGRLPDFRFVPIKKLCINICAIFLGGPDDREMLAFATRLANHPSVSLHVFRLVDQNGVSPLRDMVERNHDMRVMNVFRKENSDKNIIFREVRIEEAVELMELLRKEGDDFDLMMVGIRHEEDLLMLEGLSEWSDMKELGEVGDLLISRDLELSVSVLAVQQ
ncbi:cation/H(+) antiporter 27 [Eutrema salsugineum]|uniref:cation/H(+) antiporter 27 n=1 Tax=Eutrema salsugineum TaxID=72664 RepID=UPI000CED2996|nr:cation/H(+) antiporter 27 [Eutrema salsugineum]